MGLLGVARANTGGVSPETFLLLLQEGQVRAPRSDWEGAGGAPHKRDGDGDMASETVGRCCVEHDAEQGWHQVGGSVDAVKECGHVGAHGMGKPRLHCGMVEVAVHVGYRRISKSQASHEFCGDALFASPPWGVLPVGSHSEHAVSSCIWDVDEVTDKQQARVEAVGQVWEENLVTVVPLGTVSDWPVGVDEGEPVTSGH
jgi:hypothetical protein